MLFAAIEAVPRVPSGFEYYLGMILLLLIIPGVMMFLRLIRRISINGPQVRHDLFALPETLAGALILVLMVWLTLYAHFPGKHGDKPAVSLVGHEAHYAEVPIPAEEKETLINGMVGIALLPAIIVGIMLMRGARLSDQFGLAKIGPGQTLGFGLVLGILATALTNGVNMAGEPAMRWLMKTLFHKEEAQQLLIQRFQTAASGNNLETVVLIAFSAVIVAPVVEEILFRGSFYPVVAKGLGRILSAIVCGVIFGLAHDTYAALPGLAFLALLLTLAYEATGSLLVPMIMHMVFNSFSLGVLFWVSNQGTR